MGKRTIQEVETFRTGSVSDPLFIYVDVDETLKREVDGKDEPCTAVIAHVRELREQGALLYCWSNGGEDHARAEAQKLGIEECFAGFLRKPHVFIDDQLPHDWPCFIHVYPDKLSSLERYRSEVEAKKEEKE